MGELFLHTNQQNICLNAETLQFLTDLNASNMSNIIIQYI